MLFDLDQFEERSAICEFDGGMTRFDAETLAAREQGLARWQAVKFAEEARDAHRVGLDEGNGHHADAVARQPHADDMPGVQPAEDEENRPLPERDAQAGRDRGALPPLRGQHGAEVQR